MQIAIGVAAWRNGEVEPDFLEHLTQVFNST